MYLITNGIMKAYKVFDENFKCRGFQYEVGKTYEMKEEPILYKRGFHACTKVSDCFNYYSFDTKNKVAEVELLGIIKGEDEDKQATNKTTKKQTNKHAKYAALPPFHSSSSSSRSSSCRSNRSR